MRTLRSPCGLSGGFLNAHTGVVYYHNIEPTKEFVPPTPLPKGPNMVQKSSLYHCTKLRWSVLSTTSQNPIELWNLNRQHTRA